MRRIWAMAALAGQLIWPQHSQQRDCTIEADTGQENFTKLGRYGLADPDGMTLVVGQLPAPLGGVTAIPDPRCDDRTPPYSSTA